MRQQCFEKALCWVLYGLTILVCLLMPAYGHAESPSPAGAQAPRAAPQPPATPVLRIEAGMHTASINRIDVDAAERFLVTASDDKTARVWDLANGKLLQILRPPLGAGSEGKLYAVAISPDGTLVATGG
jgi:WD40 repeat protein